MNTDRNGVDVQAITNPANIPRDALNVYCVAFEGAPYFERFSPTEARAALKEALDKKGDLLVGSQDGQIVSVAAGYPRADGTYYLSELAVRPDKQNQGIGKTTLKAQLEAAAARRPKRIDLRTAIGNVRAQAIYRDAGFRTAVGNTVVAQMRKGGALELDERVYMFRPPISAAERRTKLQKVAIAYPSGNTTAVVFDQLLGDDRKALNNKVMTAWGKREPGSAEVEQCCFVTMPQDSRALARVEMFGNEFCGNAARSVAYLLTGGQDYKGYLEVSGASRPLRFEVEKGVVSLDMPIPQANKKPMQVAEGTLVTLEGIKQLAVIDEAQRASQSPRELLKQLLKENKYNLRDEPCVGVSYYNPTSGKAEFCVWVKEVNSMFDETACGSGTSAIGAAMAVRQERDSNLKVVQPSGETIEVKTNYSSGNIIRSTISGRVKVLYEGELSL